MQFGAHPTGGQQAPGKAVRYNCATTVRIIFKGHNQRVDTSDVLNYRRFSGLEPVRFAIEISGITPVIIIGLAR